MVIDVRAKKGYFYRRALCDQLRAEHHVTLHRAIDDGRSDWIRDVIF